MGAVGAAGTADGASMKGQFVGKLRPAAFGQEFHDIILNFYRVAVLCQGEPL